MVCELKPYTFHVVLGKVVYAGIGFTVIVTVASTGGGQLVLPETVYVVVTVGAAVTWKPLVELKPAVAPDGLADQMYEFAPEAVRVNDVPGHAVVSDVGDTTVAATEFTVTGTELVAVQPVPAASVSVAMYVPDAFGNAKVVALAGLDIVPLLAGVPLVHAYVAPVIADDALNVI